MYGLDEKTDLSFMVGRELIQVAVGRFQVIFVFDERIAISVEGGFEFHSQGEKTAWAPGSTEALAAVLNQLGETITNAQGKPDGTLILTLSAGGTLVILDSSKEYESYQITRPGAMIVV